MIGWSAGALVLGPSIAIINEFSPEMNLWGVTDFSGTNTTNVQILPHYSKFLNRYDRLEERCREYERRNNCSLVRLNDGEGILIDGDTVTVIK